MPSGDGSLFEGPIVRNRQLNFDVPELLYERLRCSW